MAQNFSSHWAAIVALLALAACGDPRTDAPLAAEARAPVIDMHLHALGAADQGPPPVGVCPGLPNARLHDPATRWADAFIEILKAPACEKPIWSPMTDDELRDRTLSELERLNVIGVLSGARERVAAWKALAPERIIAGHEFTLGDPYSADDIGGNFDQGGFEVLAEVGNQYVGAAANDARFDAYWRVAEERDIPVGIHIGTGPPGAAYLTPGHRASLSSPLALEDVLIRHPKLRVYIMHAAWPMRDELLAMLYAHPQLYVDTGVLQLALTREEYYDYLKAIVRAGFHERIMFGSDQMVWPGLIEEGIRAIEDAPFLTELQKRDILYNNAARFLRLSDVEVARHQAMGRSGGGDTP